MKVLVIGATGQTGRHAVKQLLARGHEVRAFARNPSAITQSSDRLRVVQGDARDPESIDRAMHGQDAVLSTFGPRSPKKDDVQEVLMRNLIAAMTKHGITRLVNLSAWGSGGAAVPPVNPIARYPSWSGSSPRTRGYGSASRSVTDTFSGGKGDDSQPPSVAVNRTGPSRQRDLPRRRARAPQRTWGARDARLCHRR